MPESDAGILTYLYGVFIFIIGVATSFIGKSLGSKVGKDLCKVLHNQMDANTARLESKIDKIQDMLETLSTDNARRSGRENGVGK